MSGLGLGLIAYAASAVLAFAAALAGRERLAARIAAAGAVLGGGAALAVATGVLLGAAPVDLRLAWRLPLGELHLGVDPLSALFLVPVSLVGPVAAVYAIGYLEHFIAAGKRVAAPVLLFNLLLADLTLIVTARDAFVFLVAWELMTLLAFLLVGFEHDREDVREASFVYVALSHVATMLVLALWLLLSRDSGSLDLDRIALGARYRTGAHAGLLFALALLGFGAKAGLAPLHIWLPRAHPAAPSHVSAVMSGVLVKVAIYAFVRALSLLGAPPAWWGALLLGLGAVTALGGILFALAQGDLKRLLAYSTIENVGIVFIGLGIGTLGRAAGEPAVAALGYAGALLHVVTHSVMKSLLFAGAGAVLTAAHTRSIDRLGGLLKAMPATGGAFLVGAAAIAGLPGLAGFASEWLVYAALFRGGLAMRGAAGAAAIAAIPALAAVGGLAAATLAKAAGLVFLGIPRSEEAARAREV
ncbi:MAG TPA: proton-conducting transporter membrane subunit, partial [Planctomycetota bacterium]|nr:proton-conducting transporter membrane subunit [Planctomycetota bacterium]